ncbi:hypothetical protein EYF80_019657 [Liparis tanakae]|uniref:Uncharacterized protein n=1 Tax=Liparis tanakae TaxID=230148 RepID=A0A4Z2HWC6_9TELE|nr:hypothetical protein EYF80_019657 [Liparis tanakae]
MNPRDKASAAEENRKSGELGVLNPVIPTESKFCSSKFVGETRCQKAREALRLLVAMGMMSSHKKKKVQEQRAEDEDQQPVAQPHWARRHSPNCREVGWRPREPADWNERTEGKRCSSFSRGEQEEEEEEENTFTPKAVIAKHTCDTRELFERSEQQTLRPGMLARRYEVLPGREEEAWKTEIDEEEDMQRGRQGLQPMWADDTGNTTHSWDPRQTLVDASLRLSSFAFSHNEQKGSKGDDDLSMIALN